ncbi:hypothetical protein [Spirosoma koreense]
MKDVRTYVNWALADKNVLMPFKVIEGSKPESFPHVLTQEQRQVWLALFEANDTPDSWRTVLSIFI